MFHPSSSLNGLSVACMSSMERVVVVVDLHTTTARSSSTNFFITSTAVSKWLSVARGVASPRCRNTTTSSSYSSDSNSRSRSVNGAIDVRHKVSATWSYACGTCRVSRTSITWQSSTPHTQLPCGPTAFVSCTSGTPTSFLSIAQSSPSNTRSIASPRGGERPAACAPLSILSVASACTRLRCCNASPSAVRLPMSVPSARLSPSWRCVMRTSLSFSASAYSHSSRSRAALRGQSADLLALALSLMEISFSSACFSSRSAVISACSRSLVTFFCGSRADFSCLSPRLPPSPVAQRLSMKMPVQQTQILRP